MGFIKEPDGIDFIIKGKPLTDKQKKDISEFIKADKAKRALREKREKRTRRVKKDNQTAC